jgi:Acetyltransferase (GNAT) family
VIWNIKREDGADLDLDDVLQVYQSSGLGERRPVADTERMAAMVRNANLILTCRIDGELVGIARSISDFSYVTYLSDIAVSGAHQRSGIGARRDGLLPAHRIHPAQFRLGTERLVNQRLV